MLQIDMINLKNIYTYLFFIGLFFIPFNEFEGLSFLGEYKNEAATYFFLTGFVLAVIDSFYKKKINFPYKHPLIILLSLFLFWTFLSTLFNLPSVLDNYFKHTSGINRYIRQTISLLISAFCFTFLFWSVIKNYSVIEIVLKIRKVLLYSFIFVAIYGFIEIAIVHFGMHFLKPVLYSFDYFPFVNTHISVGGRIGISSVSYEIPALGNYLIFVAPWMFSYILTERNVLRFAPTLVVLILMLFSDARAAFVVISLQLVCFIGLLLFDQRYRKQTIFSLKLVSVLLGVFLILNSEKIYKSASEKIDKLNFSKNLTNNVSNQSRLGIQYASLQVFKENPILGVGFGQGTYHMVHHYPYWATVNNWEFRVMYKNQKDTSFPPAYNIYTRLLAEIGLVGFLLFCSLVSLTVYYSVQYWKFAPNTHKYIGIILLVSFIGFAVNWFQSDFFKHYGFWLALVVLIKALNGYNSTVKKTLN